MTSKVIRINEEVLNELLKVDSDINNAVTILLQKCNNNVTNVTKELNSVTNPLQSVTDCYNKQEVDNSIFKEIQRINTNFQLILNNKIEEIRQDLINFQKRNNLK